MSDAHPQILLYVLRRDVRLADNPIFSRAAKQAQQAKPRSPTESERRNRDDSLTSEHGGETFTHLLPVFVFPANQIEVSGFLSSSSSRSPYPEARSQVAGLWRTGPHRAKFIAEGAWDLKQKLEGLDCDSGLEIRVGRVGEVVNDILEYYSQDGENKNTSARVTGVWMTGDEGTEEKADERAVERIAVQHHVKFKLWEDEKYFIDDRDLPYQKISELPNVYTTYRKSLEPIRERPRRTLRAPTQLPPLPPDIPAQKAPFKIPSSLDDLRKAILAPLERDSSYGLPNPPRWPSNVESAHPFDGGETAASNRIVHLTESGAMSAYKETRNGMLGLDFSTKISAFLAQGHLTARQVHWAMVDFEEGKGPGKDAAGYGKGENQGTAAVRFELLWRDYMRLCLRKFGPKMFDLYGIQDQSKSHYNNNGEDDQKHNNKKKWKTLHKSNGAGDDPTKTLDAFTRFRSGRTGVGLIDASNRELFLTGYTSNRARQNVASFLSSHLDIDWRIGAEWYEFLLTDYDTASNWGNWQYVAGVGNDPRQGRVFNPVKQALDYDGRGEYIKAWVPELRGIKITKGGDEREQVDQQRLMGLYQAWRLSDREKSNLGLKGVEWVERPLTRIQFSIGRGRGGGSGGDRRGNRGSWRGRGRGGGGSRDFRRLGNEEKMAKGDGGPTIVSSGEAS